MEALMAPPSAANWRLAADDHSFGPAYRATSGRPLEAQLAAKAQIKRQRARQRRCALIMLPQSAPSAAKIERNQDKKGRSKDGEQCSC